MINQNKQLLTIAIGLICLVTAACTQSVKDKSWRNTFPEYEEKVVLHKIDQKILPLDSNTALKNQTFQYIENLEAVASFNPYDNNLLLYHFNDGKLIKKISLTKKADTVFQKRAVDRYSFNYICPDSIYFFNVRRNKIYLFDSTGNAKKVFDVALKKDLGLFLNVMPGELLTIANNNFCIPSWPGRSAYRADAPLNDNLMLLQNLQTGTKTLQIKYPPIYRSALWGEYLHQYSFAYNSNKNLFVISYAITHEIYVVDSNKQVRSYYAGSKFLDHVNPLSFNNTEKQFKKDQETNNFRKQRRYTKLLYDKYEHLYYRIVASAIPESDLTSIGPNYRYLPFSIVILNEQFEKIGEQEFDANEYSGTSMFISKYGLCIPSTKTNDDRVVFDVFKTGLK